MTKMENAAYDRDAAAKREREVLAAYRGGDENALTELVEISRKPLYAFILRMVEMHDEANDIFQEVWFRAIRNIGRYKEKSFMNWLFRIAHNVIIDRARRRQTAAVAEPRPNEEDAGTRAIEAMADPAPAPDRLVIGKETGELIGAAVAALPAEQREVFLLRMDADISFKEIAAMQGVSINTALARMQYALEKIRAALTLREGETTP